MKKVSVFFIDGFLDSGKTTFITETIKKGQYPVEKKSLIITCERGSQEYDEYLLSQYNTEVYYLKKDEYNAKAIDKIYQEIKPSRIIFENNCFWNTNELSLPNYMEISQYIAIIDGSNFKMYFNNFRQKFTDMISFANVVAFTRLKDNVSLQEFNTTLKLVNKNAFYCLINEQCITFAKAFEDILPYDYKADKIEIKDDDFGDFYIDSFDYPDRYENKTVNFSGFVIKNEKLKSNEVLIARQAITCCANDIQIFGFLLRFDTNIDLENNTWINMSGVCHKEFSKEYQEEEIVIYVKEYKQIDKIKNDVLKLV